MRDSHGAPQIFGLAEWTFHQSAELGLFDLGGLTQLLPNDDLIEIWADQQRSDVFVLKIPETASFHISMNQQEITVGERRKGIADHIIDHLLADQVAPRILSQQGELIVHASAVIGEGGAVLFVGPSGRGKSTLAASLSSGGASLLGDDAMWLSEKEGLLVVRSVSRTLRLYPDSIQRVFEIPPRHDYVNSYSEKRRIELESAGLDGGEAVKLAGFFLLTPEREISGVEISDLRLSEACMAIIENSFSLDAESRALAEKKLKIASQIAQEVPGFNLAYRRDYSILSELRRAVNTHLMLRIGRN